MRDERFIHEDLFEAYQQQKQDQVIEELVGTALAAGAGAAALGAGIRDLPGVRQKFQTGEPHSRASQWMGKFGYGNRGGI